MTVIKTALTEMLGIDHPILLAPMASASGGRLAGAVTQAGGLGLISSGYADRTVLTEELSNAGNIKVGIGFITWVLDERPETLDIALASKPPAIMLSFGDPTPYIDTIKIAGSKVICQVQTLAQAEQAAQSGADIIVAQGRDAGGHSGTTRGTIALVPAVVDAVGSIPVVAAGGITDGRGLAAALSLGAAGVLMGTRFTVSNESLWSDTFKQSVIAANGDQTEQTRIFDIVRDLKWPEQYPGRVIKNTFFTKWHGHESELQAIWKNEKVTYDLSSATDTTTRPIWTGEGIDLITEILPASEIIKQIMTDAVATLKRGYQMLV